MDPKKWRLMRAGSGEIYLDEVIAAASRNCDTRDDG